MKKELIFALVFLFFIGLYFVNAAVTTINPGHSSEQIYIQYCGRYIILQKAIDSTSLASISSYDTLPTTTPYHLASQIFITKGGYTMTLQEAIDNSVFATGATHSYTTILPAGGEFATSINVSTSTGFMTLQEAINQNKLSHVGQSQSCTLSGDVSCINLGTIQCDGSCSATYKPKGTDCAADDWHACNETGRCLGWSGYGCTSCPFGFTQFACCPSGSSPCATGWSCGTCNNLGIYRGFPDYYTRGWALAPPICGVAKLSQYIVINNDWKMKP